MKRSTWLKSSVLAVGITGVFGISTYADTIENLEDRQSELEDEREDVRQDLDEAESEINEVLTELEELNQELDELNEARKENQKTMDDTEEEIDSTEDEIAELEEDIEEIEKDIEIRTEIINERLISYHRNGGDVAYIEVILGSKNMGDLISRSNAVKKIMDSDKRLIEKQQEDKATVKKKQDEVNGKLQELEDMQTEIQGMLALIEDQEETAENKKDSLKDKESELVALQEELQIQDSELASMQSDVRDQIEQQREEERQENIVLASHSSSGDNTGNVVQGASTNSSNNSSPAPKASGSISTAVNAGMPHLGTPYQWAGTTTTGFDCSGFVHWAFKQAGINVPSSTAGLSSTGSKISYSQAQPGDLVFFNTYKTNGHVGIYLGNGKFIGAQNSTGLAVADMNSGYWKDHFAGHVRTLR